MFTCEDFPKPYILVEPQSQIALRGKDLTLYCRAASTSPAQMNFVWKKDGTVVEEEECLDQRRCVEVRNIGLYYLIIVIVIAHRTSRIPLTGRGWR